MSSPPKLIIIGAPASVCSVIVENISAGCDSKACFAYFRGKELNARRFESISKSSTYRRATCCARQ